MSASRSLTRMISRSATSELWRLSRLSNRSDLSFRVKVRSSGTTHSCVATYWSWMGTAWKMGTLAHDFATRRKASSARRKPSGTLSLCGG